MSVVPTPNTELDSNGLPITRFLQLNEPVFAPTTNRASSDLNERDNVLASRISGNDHDGILSFFKIAPTTPASAAVAQSAGKIYINGGRTQTTIAANTLSSLGFSNIATPGNSRFDLIGLNISVNPPTALKVQGTEAVSPTRPSIPSNMFPVAYIFVNETGTVLVEEDDIFEARRFLEIPSTSLPVGSLIDIAYTPDGTERTLGWLPCVGQTIGDTGSGADFAGPEFLDLFTKMNTVSALNPGSAVFSNGDTVLLPDLTQRITIHVDSSDSSINDVGKLSGSKTISVSIPAHSHSVGAHTHPISTEAAHTHTGTTDVLTRNVAPSPRIMDASADIIDDHVHDFTTDAGGAHAHGGATGNSSSFNTGNSSVLTSNVSQYPPVFAVYKLIKF